MKFPIKVKAILSSHDIRRFTLTPVYDDDQYASLDPHTPCTISIAAVNAVVKTLVRRNTRLKRSQVHSSTTIASIAARTIKGKKVQIEFNRIADMDGNPFGHRIKAEIERRATQKTAATINLGEKTLVPCVCLKVKLQVITINGLPAEDPKAQPKFRVQLRYWNGRVHTLWSDLFNDYEECGYFTVKIKRKSVNLHFDNHEIVLKTIKELMP